MHTTQHNDSQTRHIQTIQQDVGLQLAEQAFSMGAIRLNTENPFRWASGYRMPIYNDNRQLLQSPSVRKLIADGFRQLLEALSYKPDHVAGTATAGIPHATTLADMLGLPLSYVRSSNKDHGLGNKIEGLPPEGSYQGEEVVLIEDLLSTGGSSIAAVQAVRGAEGRLPYCLAIFTYGLETAKENFAALDPDCTPLTILTYDLMVEAAQASGYITSTQAASLTEWRESPFTWGEQRGFSREVRS
ncbi:MAG: orotate phosphoribosyltransferase [Spirochaetota bacterium]